MLSTITLATRGEERERKGRRRGDGEKGVEDK